MRFCYLTNSINSIQETQLSLTNRATRLRSVKVTKHGTNQYVTYGFLLVYCSSLLALSVRRTVFRN